MEMKKTRSVCATAVALALMLATLPVRAQILNKVTYHAHTALNAVAPSETFTGNTTITVECAQPRDTITAIFTIAETGTTGGVINRVFQSDTTHFFDLLGTLPDDSTWTPSKSPQPLAMGDTATISVRYVLPVDRNDTVVDSVFAIDEDGDTIGGGPVVLTVITESCADVTINNVSDPSLNATVLPTNDGRSMEIILPSSIATPVNFQLFNVLGESVQHSTFSTGTQTVDASSLPRGVYFYRLTAGQMSQSGKIILGE
jgi:hypothetical protein